MRDFEAIGPSNGADFAPAYDQSGDVRLKRPAA